VFEQLDFLFPRFRTRPPPTPPQQDVLKLPSREVPLRFIHNESARRYILRVTDDGAARVTVPRRGSVKAAREFAHQHLAWLEKQFQKRDAQPTRPISWTDGTEILFRGEPARLIVDSSRKEVRLADQTIAIRGKPDDLRPLVERHLIKVAVRELAPCVWKFASLHQLTVHRVTVRGQRSRWGSCSTRKTISLNWRLIQAPSFVRDYIILHELMHLREMNHSRRFWRHVEQACPDYAKAEAWLNRHSHLLK